MHFIANEPVIFCKKISGICRCAHNWMKWAPCNTK